MCDPGACWSYAHTNFVILGQVLEKVAGQAARRLIREGILEPLKLDGHPERVTAAIPEPVLHAFDAERGRYEESTFWDPSWTLAHGAIMTSTVGDILTSAAAIGEGTLVRPASHALQLAPLTAKFPPWNEKMWYGFGVFVINGWIVQNPSFAGYAATMAYLPERKLGDRRLDDDAARGVAGGEPLDRPAEGDRRRPRAGGATLGDTPRLQAWVARPSGSGWRTKSDTITELPSVRGTLTADRPMAELTWLRVGGPADWLFQPADEADLADFLRALPPAVPVFPMGVGSNLIVRDGGIAGVVVRLGRGFNGIRVEGDRVIAGAAALDAHVARKAAEAGIDLTFLRTIPGSIGGRGADERRLLRHLYRRRLRLGAGGDAGGRGGGAGAGGDGLRLPLDGPARGPGRHRGDARRSAGRSGGAGAADGGAAGAAGREPADEGALGGLDLPQSGGVLLHRAGGRRARSQGLEADRGRRHEGRNPGWSADVAEARQLPDQHRGAKAADLENLGELVRKKVLESTGIHARVGNHAGRPTIRPADNEEDGPDKAGIRPRGQD